LVHRAGRERDVLLTSEDAARMHRLRATAAGVAFGASRDEVAGWFRAAATGSMPPPGPMALQLPVAHEGTLLVTPALVALAHAHGVAVHVWTVNDPTEMQRLIDLGVDGIVTDEPRVLVRVLRRGGDRVP
jgi:glycerophosphoryl diester phosphodiesterase